MLMIKNLLKNSLTTIVLLSTIVVFSNNKASAQNVDAAITQFVYTNPSPIGSIHNGTNKTLQVRIRNVGNIQITAVKIGWTVNGTPQADVNQAAVIAVPSVNNQIPTITVNLSTTYADVLGNNVTAYIKEVTTLSGSDINTSNDTINATFGSPLAGGTMTIGKLPGDHFKSFKDAINALRYNGLSADITFKVRAGSYDQDLIDLDATNVYFPNGAKKITFESFSGSRDVILLSEAALQTTVKLTGIDYFTINNIRIINRNIVTGVGVNLLGGANYCTIKNCEVTVDSISNTKAFVGILSGALGTAPAYTISSSNTGSAKFLTVKYNKIAGGYYGIATVGFGTNRDTLSQIDSNTIQQVSYYGVYITNAINTKARGNKVVFRPSADVKSIGYFFSTINTAPPQNIEISKNYVTDAGQYGMYLSSVVGTGTPTNRYVNITNNMIAGGFFNNYSNATNTFNGTETPVGLYLTGVGWANVFFNSVLMDAPSKTNTVDNTTAFYVNGAPTTGNIFVYNNIFYNANKGYSYYNISTTNPILVSDNNDLFVAKLDTNGSQETGFAYWGGAIRLKPSALVAASGKDKNSFSKDPLFFSNSDLHTINPDLDQKGSTAALSQVPLDYDGQERDFTNAPDIGCDEFEVGAADYAIVAVSPDVFKYNKPTPWDITVRWQGQNVGNATLLFRYKINDQEVMDPDSVISLTYNRLTGYFKSQKLSVPLHNQIVRNNYQQFKLTVYLLKRVGDDIQFNDTLTMDVCVGLEGVFTIDPNASPGPTTFTSFQEVYDYLKCGVAGPTTFEIADGVYDEQISLWKVRNSSSTNTITFKSKNNLFATKLTYANGTAENHATVLFNNAQYITLRDLTIENRSAVNGTCIQLAGNSKFNVIRNNIIRVDSTLTNFPNSLIPIVSTKLGTLTTGQFASNAQNNTIMNNRIYGGWFGIAMYGSDTDKRDLGNIVERNTITSFHKAAIYLKYADTRIIKNVIAGKSGMEEVGFGIWAENLGDRDGVATNDISGNKIYDISYQGILLNLCLGKKNVGAKKSTFTVSNNMIGGGFTRYNSTTSGLFLNSCLAISILHNTIYMDAPRTSNTSVETNPPFARCLIINNTNTNIEAFNNILYSRNGAIPLEYFNATGNQIPNGLIESDFNLYYTFYNSKNTPLCLIRRTRKTNQNTTTTNYTFSQLSQTPLSALTTFKAATGNTSRDRKSLALPLIFEEIPYDFHTFDLTVEGKGAGGLDVVDDIDSDPRKSKTTDIGCDEFTVPNYDLDINKILNPLLSAIKPNQIQVRLRNRGKYPLENITVQLEYRVEDAENGFLFTNTESVKLNMKKTGDSQVFKFTNKVSVPKRGYYNVCVLKVSGLSQDTVYTNDKRCVDLCTGIEGDYYVGFTTPLPNTDTNRYYTSIQSAFNNVECGIADDTYFHLNPAASPYVERVTIPKYLVNLDSPLLTMLPYNTTSNTAVQIVQPASGGDNSKNHYTVRFNGANFVKLLNLNIKNTGNSYGTGIHFTKKSNNNIVEGCKIEVSTNSTTPFFFPIASSSANKLDLTDIQSYGKNSSYNTIKKNQLIGGYAGISMLGASVVDFDVENIIDSNVIQDYYQFGIYSINNTINRIAFNQLTPSVTPAASCVSISYNYAGEGGIINANKIINSKQIGIKIYGVEGFYDNRMIVANNWITHSFSNSIADSSSAILVKRSNNIGIYYNSIRYNGFVAALNIRKELTSINPSPGPGEDPDTVYSNPSSIHVINNIIQVDSLPAAPKKPYVIWFTSEDPTSIFNNNDYHTGYLSKFGFYPPLIQSTFEVWRQNTASDANSLNELPKFVSEYDLNMSPLGDDSLQFDKRGVVVPGISRDYNNRKRSPRVTDIGSLEYEKENTDVSILNIINKKSVYGVNTFSVTLLNEGNFDLSTQTVGLEYSVDSGKTWIGAETVVLKELKSRYDEQVFAFALKYTKNDFLSIPLCVRIDPSARLAGDTITKYEQICTDLCVGLEKGIYTIGHNGTEDFSLIQEAVTSLVCGFDSSVVFKMSPGTYDERITIPAIETNKEKTVTFESATGLNTDVTLTYTVTGESQEHHIFQLDGSRFVTFRNLRFTSKQKARVSGIHIADTSNNITVDHCVFDFDSTATANTLVGVLASGKVAFTDPASASYNTIRNSKFIGGGFGIRLLGVKNNAFSGPNKVVNNIFRSNYTAGIDIFYTQIDSVSNNDIIMRKGNKDNVGINIYGALTDFIITSNKIAHAQNVGLSIDSCRTISRGLIANNMIAGGFVSDNIKNEAGILLKSTGAFPAKGINSSGTIDVINNSVYYDGNGDSAAALFVLRSNSLNIYNNIFANYGPGYAFQFISDPSSVVEFPSSDANVLYTQGQNLAKWKQVVCPTIADIGVLESGTTPFNGTNAKNINPLYKSSFDLHRNVAFIDENGEPFSGIYSDLVLTDIDGQPRSILDPDIGCDEFFPLSDLKMEAFITPLDQSTFKNENEVIVKVRNVGSDAYTVKVKYMFDGVYVDSVVKNYAGTPLKYDSTDIFVFKKKFSTRQAGPHILAAYTEIRKPNPNGPGTINDDFSNLNDTIKITVVSKDTSDIGVSEFISPRNGILIAEPTPVQLSVTNYGNLTASNFKIHLKVNGKLKETKIVTTPVLGKEIHDYDFNYLIDPDTAVFFEICAVTELYDDVIDANDSICIVVFTVGVSSSTLGKELFSVHPNPTSGNINFGIDINSDKNVEIGIYDLSSRLMKYEKLGVLSAGKQNLGLDCADLSEGTYFFAITIGDQKYNGRFVIIK